MAVLALMYHATPPQAGESPYDVALPCFREQVAALADSGARFCAFDEISPALLTSSNLFVCVTFDDGHVSNAKAFEILAGRAIRPTGFIVTEWSRRREGYLRDSDIAGLSSVSDFGGHGATHTDLTSLNPQDLISELKVSRAYLEQILAKPVHTMAAPGGCVDARVVRAAQASGFSLIGNSVPLLNRRKRPTINRVAVRAEDSARDVAALVSATLGYWQLQSTRVAARTLASRTLGRPIYEPLVASLKKMTRQFANSSK